MRCPSCGTAANGSMVCGECGHNLVELMTTSEPDTSNLGGTDTQSTNLSPQKPSPGSRLIEFPGVSRTTVPGWRKEVAERVREAQERRAREAAAEAQLAASQNPTQSLHQLELLPQAEVPPMNPLVAAALKRIERAYTDPPPAMAHSRRRSRMAAVAYATESAFPSLAAEPLESPMTTPPTNSASADEFEKLPAVEERPNAVEKAHSLIVVQPTIAVANEVPKPATPKRHRRVISDDLHNPALNYLDSISTIIHPEDVKNRAPAFRRFVAGVIDMLVLGVFFAPFATGAQLLQAGSEDIRVVALAATTLLAISFLYSTFSTALTGRTLGMKMLSLRVVDSRTGLIPTGKQSAGRALIFNMSLLTAGIVLVYALVDPEKRTAHDKLTQTAVIQV